MRNLPESGAPYTRRNRTNPAPSDIRDIAVREASRHIPCPARGQSQVSKGEASGICKKRRFCHSACWAELLTDIVQLHASLGGRVSLEDASVLRISASPKTLTY
jgi:hypothetical protein